MNRLNVRFLPSLISTEEMAGATVLVIDILRASTTIVHALAAGARFVKPCRVVEDAREFASQHPETVLGGERGGVKIKGFDFGNSPTEYTPTTVRERVVAFTTTNGTKAMMHCHNAGRVLIGSFVNLTAVCRSLDSADHIELICAGTGNEITLEDVLFAGAVASQLNQQDTKANDQAAIANSLWQATKLRIESGESLADSLTRGLGGQNLVKLGLDKDIEIAARIDQFDCVPEYDLATGQIV